MKILFTGGGTLGPVTPLLAIIAELKNRHPAVEIVFVGTSYGPEKRLVDKMDVPFFSISAPKLRRYLSAKNLMIPVQMAKAMLQAKNILKRERPSLVVGAGGYTSVPMGLMARMMGIKLLIHQQDVVPSMSNKILAPFADAITVTFESSLMSFPGKKTFLTGNPVRPQFEKGNKEKGRELLGIKSKRPLVLAVGGGTGSEFLNEIILLGTPKWTQFADLVHITGLNKSPFHAPALEYPERYHQLDFVGEDIVNYFSAADLVISRAGLGTTSELALLSKPMVLIPIPDSHQEANASYIVERGGGRMFRELDLTPEQLVTFTKVLIEDKVKMKEMGKTLNVIFQTGAREKVTDKILELLK